MVNMLKDSIGTIQVYTGDGKGKTTAALGQALRAWGHGQRVLVLQFMKGRINYGELSAAERLEGFDIVQCGRETFVNKENPEPEDIKLAQRGLKLARKEISAGKYDLIVLDELNVALDYNLVSLDEVLEILSAKPKNMEIIITGRYAPPKIMEIADLVSEVREVKHHYQDGTSAREGVEY